VYYSAALCYFFAETGRQNEGHHRDTIKALLNCTFTIGGDLAFVKATIPGADRELACNFDNESGEVMLETNQVTLVLFKKAFTAMRIMAKGQPLSQLLGNCQVYNDNLVGTGDVWLQMGPKHCIKMERGAPTTWEKAETNCQHGHKGHLLSIHNGLDEMLVQNLVFNRYEKLTIIATISHGYCNVMSRKKRRCKITKVCCTEKSFEKNS
jgi:hypothetical protein